MVAALKMMTEFRMPTMVMVVCDASEVQSNIGDGFDDQAAKLLGGSWDLVSTLILVISIATLIITLVTKSHGPSSSAVEIAFRAEAKAARWHQSRAIRCSP